MKSQKTGFEGFKPYAQKQIERKKVELAYRIADYMEDFDPYGFRDSLEGETIEEGLENAARETLGYINSGQYDEVISWLGDTDCWTDSPHDLEMKQEMESIISGLKWLKENDSRTKSKGKKILRSLKKKPKNKISAEYMEFSNRAVEFMEEADPYGFVDLRGGETMDEALHSFGNAVCHYLREGNFDAVRYILTCYEDGWLQDAQEFGEEELIEEYKSILEELDRLERKG